MTAPDTAFQITYDVPNHQVLLSFNGDLDAYGFHHWWENEGLDIFLRWMDAQEDRK